MQVDDVRIRRGTVDDAAHAAKVISESWVAAYRALLPDRALYGRDRDADAAQIARLTEQGPPGSGVLVAEAGDSVVGVSLFGPTPDGEGGVALLYMLYTAPEAWGSEAGHLLFEGTVDAIRSESAAVLAAEVLDRNRRARAFFERNGMVEQGSGEQHWFGVPVTVVRYALTL